MAATGGKRTVDVLGITGEVALAVIIPARSDICREYLFKQRPKPAGP